MALAGQAVHHRLMTMSLLLVEDSALVRTSMLRLLESVPFIGEIEVAGTVALMLDRVRAAPPSMLIVDFHLPDGNALRTLPLLKALAPAMKIAAFSNDATTFHRAASLQAGADWFFDKSAEFPQLLDLVRDRAAAH